MKLWLLQRPDGIVILVILEVIDALGLLLTGFTGLVGSAFLGTIASGPLGAFVAIIGVFLIAARDNRVYNSMGALDR